MEEQKQNNSNIPYVLVIIGLTIALFVSLNKNSDKAIEASTKNQVLNNNIQAVLVDGGHILSLESEKKLLATLIANGVIDSAKLSQVNELNLFWAFGLANKNIILENGPIANPQYGGVMNMASVGGWTVSQGSPMNHYGKHSLVSLTSDQQALVEKVAKGIYRPCCDNSTHFPDCNHGMAMLGLLELLASEGATEDQLWNTAITANMIWFPNQYQTIAQYIKQKGIDLKNVSPKEILGAVYSSVSGFSSISRQVPQSTRTQNGGCGVDSGQSVNTSILPTQPQQNSCGVQ